MVGEDGRRAGRKGGEDDIRVRHAWESTRNASHTPSAFKCTYLVIVVPIIRHGSVDGLLAWK